MKRVTVITEDDSADQEREVETVQKALQDLASEAAEGDLPLPYTVTFPGPGDTEFSITVKDADSAQELARAGFKF